MGENPLYPKIIERTDSQSEKLYIGEMGGKVKYTSDWENVDGGKGVSCRTWVIDGVDANIDGADIKIEKGGFTPVQLVKSAEVVVDSPETGRAFCVVMDTDGEIYTNYFDGSEKMQMVWSQGMIITWIAETETRLTEFESPIFSEDMFKNIPDGTSSVNDLELGEYFEIVDRIRSGVQK